MHPEKPPEATSNQTCVGSAEKRSTSTLLLNVVQQWNTCHWTSQRQCSVAHSAKCTCVYV